MVATQYDNNRDAGRFLLRPNCSLSWRDALRFYIGMVIVTFGIAIAFAVQGAWLILPFAGLEMLVLGMALYVVSCRGTSWQAISIDQDSIDIIDHGFRHEQQQSFQRAWAKVVFKRALIKGHPSRLFIRSHGRAVEIGGYLNESEKKHLAHQLNRAMRPVY